MRGYRLRQMFVTMRICRVKLAFLVGADSDHNMDATGMDGYPSIHDDHFHATLVACQQTVGTRWFRPTYSSK